MEVIFRCPNSKCYEVFICYYWQDAGLNYILGRSEPRKHNDRPFSETIKEISKDFSTIYNQALQAENDNLTEICGPGYRKGLEFLVKDYLIGHAVDEDEKNEIKAESLGDSIKNRIQDAHIKEVAKRAVWLGNDETHYIRKWEQKDLKDLKKLIDLTVHWMEAEALTKELLIDMPDGKKTT